MKRQIQAELLRLGRKRPIIGVTVFAFVFALVGALTIFASASEAGSSNGRGQTSVAALSAAGGGTESFVVSSSFIGVFIFLTFIALVAGEFSGGTFRASLLRNPCRRTLIVGKLAGILLLVAGVVALTELFGFLISLAIAPSNDVSTSKWFDIGAVEPAIVNYLTVMSGVFGWAVFGTTLAVIFRSTPIAIGAGFAWSGPFENIISDSWDPGLRYFPGQVFAAVIRGGTLDLSMERALLTAAIYVAAAAAIALTLVSRRDVTA